LPDRRAHRGPHPEDAQLFGPGEHERLRQAVADLSWLLSRGYVNPSALVLVGDRYRLTARQRVAVERAACSDQQLQRREEHRVQADAVRGRPLWIDGYNVLCTVEAALAGGVLLAARDGTLRDMASMHGSYRKVAETRPALELVGRVLQNLQVAECVWLLDKPVSNSGRLKKIMQQVAAENHWQWQIELVTDPDPVLMETKHVVASADSVILDYCLHWLNLTREVVHNHVPNAWIVDLGTDQSHYSK